MHTNPPDQNPQLSLAQSRSLERGDLLGVVSAGIELFEERLRWWWVVVPLEPVH